MVGRLVLVLIASSICATVAFAVFSDLNRKRHFSELTVKLDSITHVDVSATEVSCAEMAQANPLVILALGQSNAGNHGVNDETRRKPVNMVADGKCVLALDPLPGGTGHGASIWQRLPVSLEQNGLARPVVLSVLAVDATAIDDWVATGSPLRERLVAHLASMRRVGLLPRVVLWQQGEADARIGSSRVAYGNGLDKLALILDETTLSVPIVLAQSTVCNSPSNLEIRQAIMEKVSSHSRWRLGPDSDQIVGSAYREGGCHFTALGLDRVARMWSNSLISAELVKQVR